MRLGFVGTGTMGAAMAGCLIDAGHDLTIYDLRAEATVGLTARGASAADSPAAAADRSEVVFTSLPGPAEVEFAVLDRSSGILAGLRAGGAYIDTTTNAPGVARRGVDVLDAPVSGRPPGMTMMVGGDESVLARYCPLLAAMSRNIFHVGDTGAGCTAKLVTQYLGYTNFIAALEGLLIGAKAGIDPGVLARIVPVSAGASRTFDNIPRSVLSGTFTAIGTLDIVAKDLLAHDVLSRAQARGWGQHGFPTAAKILEAMAGCELRAPAVEDAPPSYQAEDPRRSGN
jgi:3-hydroxyisobutyrate dehydrogenase